MPGVNKDAESRGDCGQQAVPLKSRAMKVESSWSRRLEREIEEWPGKLRMGPSYSSSHTDGPGGEGTYKPTSSALWPEAPRSPSSMAVVFNT